MSNLGWRERVYFERRAATGKDDHGNPRAGAFARFWPPGAGEAVAARITPLRGNEQVLAHRLEGVMVWEIRIRDGEGPRSISTGDRVVNARTGEIYAIRASLNPDEKGIDRVFTCETGRAA